MVQAKLAAHTEVWQDESGGACLGGGGALASDGVDVEGKVQQRRRRTAIWWLLYLNALGVVLDAALLKEVELFNGWRRLSRALVAERVSCKSLYADALAQAKRLVEEAAAGSAKAFAVWLQEGPAKGLKRQHQLSRTATGGFPPRVGGPMGFAARVDCFDPKPAFLCSFDSFIMS